MIDVATRKGTGSRAVGELVARAAPDAPALPGGEALPLLTGFENHGGVTTVGPEASPLGEVVTGIGNGGGDGTEGAWRGQVVGTYLHGPVLARNPALADLLLGWAIGRNEALEPLDDVKEGTLRSERLAAATSSAGASVRAWLRRLHRSRV